MKEFSAQVAAAFSLAAPADPAKRPGSMAGASVTRASERQGAVPLQLDDRDADSFYVRLRHNIARLTDEWDHMAVKMADGITGTVTSAMQGLGGAIANVIVGTQSAGRAFTQLGIQMLTGFIANVVQMILMATVAIPILTALGVLSGGSIPTAGLAATSVALAGASSLAGRYASGGPIRAGSGPRADDVMIHASRGEYVLNAAAVNYYGEAFIGALNQRMVSLRNLADAIPRGVARPISRGAYADGGYVDQGAMGGNVNVLPAPVNVAVLNSRAALLQFMEQHGAAMAFDYAKKHKHELGVRS